MTGLYDSAGNLIAGWLWYTDKQDAVKVVNRLLSGQYHVQIIGSAALVLECRVICGSESKGKIDSAHATGAPVKVVDGDRYWVGIIKDEEALSWEWQPPDFWQAEFTLVVTEGGVV